ncbi:MAG: sigma-70 family RNA polymerase sigma factor [Chitinophagales bacterium]
MVPVDKDKVRKACKGDNGAFSDLIQERKDDIYRIAYTYMKNSEDALDIVHEVVYKAFLSVKKIKNPEFYNTWLTKVTINCCIDHLKKNRRFPVWEEKYGIKELEYISDHGEDDINLIAGIDLFKQRWSRIG